jgi:hypothetical protein
MDERAPHGPTRRRLVTAAVGAILAIAAVAILYAVVSNGDDDEDGTSTEATTTAAPATTATTSTPTSSSAAPSSTRPSSLTGEEASDVVWPSPEDSTRYDDPRRAAEAFAIELVGFESPVIGEFRQGDTRSGEVGVRPLPSGPETTVLVRQMSDGNWWVLGSQTDSIVLDDPLAGTAIDDPLQLSGRARAFEGTVQVAVFRRGSTTPLGEGFVTGSGGEELGPFTGELRWDNPGGGWGAVVLHTASGENGQVWQALAVPVGFIGGD